MFIMAIVNFLLYSLNVGIQVACFIVFIRTALTLDIDYPLSGRSELIDNALENLDVIRSWASFLPVSVNLLLLDPVSIHIRRRWCSVISSSFGELGPFSEINGG